MKDIDWSEAPDGATHVGIDGCDDIQWYKNILPNGGYHYWACEQWNKTAGTPISKGITPRPTQCQGPQDGLPPIGYTQDDCAMVHLDESDKFTVVAHHHGYAIVAFGPGSKQGTVMSTAVKADEFSPKLSEKDKVVAEMWRLMDECDLGLSGMAENLYEAGFRKTMSRQKAIYTMQRVVPDLDTTQAMAIADMLGHLEE